MGFQNSIPNNLDLKEGDTVKHTIFGEGVVLSIENDKIATIAFKYGIGIKTIIINAKFLSKK